MGIEPYSRFGSQRVYTRPRTELEALSVTELEALSVTERLSMECDAGSALHDAGWSGNRKIEGTLDSSSDRLGAAYCVSSLKISDEK